MAQEQRSRSKSKKNKDLSITIDSISSDHNEIDMDNVRLIDYGDKDDEIFKDLSIDGEETVDELDITKIYENELEGSEDGFGIGEENMKKIKEFEGSINQRPLDKKGLLSTLYPNMEIGYNSKVPDLNSDVDNDICKENIKKIYTYLNEDMQKEEEIEKEIERTLKYIKSITDK